MTHYPQADEEFLADLDEVIEWVREGLAGEDLESAIGLLARAADQPVPDPDIAAALGWALADRYTLHGGGHDLDEAVTWLRRVCDPPAAPDPADDLRLAELLIERAEQRGEAADITAAIGYAQRALAGLSGDLCAFAHYLLGLAHFIGAGLGAAPAEFSSAAGHLRVAAGLLPDDSQERADAEIRLGVVLATWACGDQATDGAGQLDEAISLLAKARREIAPGDALLARIWLGMASIIRFTSHAGSEADIQVALSAYEELLAQPALEASIADLCHCFAAFLLLYRSAPESMRRASTAIDTRQLARLLAKPPPQLSADAARLALDHLDRVSGVIDPAFASLEPFLRGVAKAALGGGELPEGEVTPTVTAFEQALRRTPDGDPSAGELRVMLGLLYGERAMRETGGRTSGRSVESLVAAAQQLGDDHPMLPLVRGLLGGAFGLPLGGRQPSRAESTAAIDMLETFLEELADDHPARAEVLIRLGSLLISRAFELRHSLPRLRKLRRRLDEAISRPAASPLSDAANHALLGMAEGIEGLLEPDADLMESAVNRIKQAAGVAPPGARIQGLIHGCLIGLLCQRFSQDGELQYLDAAIYYAGQMVRAAADDEIGEVELVAHYLLACAPAARNPGQMDQRRVDEMIAQMAALQARIPEHHPLRQSMAAELNALRVMRGAVSTGGSPFGAAWRDPASLAEAADAAIAIARATSPDNPFYPMNLGMAGNARAMQGVLLGNRSALSEGMALLGEACAAAKGVPDLRRRLLSTLAVVWRMRFEITRNRNDLSNMISLLQEARRLADGVPAGSDRAGILYMSAHGYHDRDDQNLQDRRRAAVVGLDALHERSTTVLVQSTADRAFDAALAAAGEAADVARWCLADGNTEAAVEALERGRGMVLHAAVADASMPSLLREADQDELAEEWEQALSAAERGSPYPWDLGLDPVASLRALSGPAENEVTGPRELQLPSDLRHRVMQALQGAGLERLLSPPTKAEIVLALQTADAQGLVYLLPRDEPAPGLAMIIDATGETHQIELPQLAARPRGPIADFARAQQDLYGDPSVPEDAYPRWQRALDDLCDWAWTVAMDRVLGSFPGAPRQQVRLVIVPVGDLGLVPWHAARRPVAGGALRYACQDAVISYAASARQFTEASRNGHRPWPSAAAVIRVPDSESKLRYASIEAEEIHRHHYANGIFLGGPDGESPPASAERVLGLLPQSGTVGVSLLHLACHAAPGPRPADGRLLLQGGETLRMRDILHQARSRPRDTPGCLVILAACGTDLTGDHHDEALTLATSFLAAGAVGAVGTRWPVADLPTLIFMIMFHHYLNSGYSHPSTALRATQCWMLNPKRTYPEDFPPKIATKARLLDLTTAEWWAAFTYQGQ
jgi:hypothetical protein